MANAVNLDDLSTDVIRGRSGPASIVAAQFW